MTITKRDCFVLSSYLKINKHKKRRILVETLNTQMSFAEEFESSKQSYFSLIALIISMIEEISISLQSLDVC